MLCAETAAKGVCSGSMESILSCVAVYFVSEVLVDVIDYLSVDVDGGIKRRWRGRKGE